jgi:hypothetical protein
MRQVRGQHHHRKSVRSEGLRIDPGRRHAKTGRRQVAHHHRHVPKLWNQTMIVKMGQIGRLPGKRRLIEQNHRDKVPQRGSPKA